MDTNLKMTVTDNIRDYRFQKTCLGPSPLNPEGKEVEMIPCFKFLGTNVEEDHTW